ncbi:O-antigen ligase family protein [Sphingobacterium faecium]|uniref:O-antigen ligase family protein n=1 Tax=Sphingobacterium faecium TaxID=34087 RepID=UPI0032082C41
MVQGIAQTGKIEKFILLLFSFFLAFGKYDPFHTGGLYFDAITVFALIVIFSNANKSRLWNKEYSKQYYLLFSIALLFYIASMFYGLSYTNEIPIKIKYIFAITIFIFFSYKFSEDESLKYKSLLLFGLACGLIAVGYKLGLFNKEFQFNKGRLLIFGENPNSISARLAAGFIALYYNILEDPLRLGKKRFVLAIFLIPLVLFVIDTGSRGSFIILVLGFILLTLVSKIHIGIKFFLGLISLFIASYLLLALEQSSLLSRFQDKDITGGRERIWNIIFEIVQNNLWGVGEEGYLIEMGLITDRVQDAHNLFLYLLVCGGWLALTLFLIFLWKLFRKSYVQFRKKNVLPFIFFVFFVFLMTKTGGIMTYLIMWYFLAYINSYSLTDRQYEKK